MPSLKPQIKAVLEKDKKLKKLISFHEPVHVRKTDDAYLSLLNSIVSQQLSVKAAATIWGRFLDLFPKRYPEPKLVLKMKDETMRGAGLSFQKAGYIKNIAEFSLVNPMDVVSLNKLDDEALVAHLTQIKGVGKWTVQMIMMFSLQRMDVFPEDDLGIQNAIKNLYALESDKKQLKADMHQIAQKWQPYRTVACMYLWKHKDNKPIK